MAETAVITATVRHQKGSRAARKLRASGQVPAVIYGHKEAVVQLAVSSEQLENLLRHGGHGLIDIQVDGKSESAVIKDMQWDVFGREILHVDFSRVSSDERVTLEIPIKLKGNAPGVNEGGVLDQPMHSIEIECPATNIQENIVVNVSGLHLDQAIYVRDLTLPEGITTSEDPDQVVVHVIRAAGEEVEEAGEATAEPELIRREKAAADEGEE